MVCTFVRSLQPAVNSSLAHSSIGTTIVQYRDKTSDTAEVIQIAKELHKVCRAANVPLLINDRIDVALAVGVEGVHIGQDDMNLKSARKILGPDAIIGVTTNNEEEALQAAQDGADYLGIGTVYATQTKENTKTIIGTAGVQQILTSLAKAGHTDIKTVCIGGVNASNAQRILYQSTSPLKKLDGVAVVSAIMGSEDARASAENLKHLLSQPPPFAPTSNPQPLTSASIKEKAPPLLARLASLKPLSHNMTNLVVQNFAANVALAIGASPIMSNNGLEAGDLAALGGALVVNMGSTTPEARRDHLQAVAAYNAAGGPVVLDPVGAGATEQRREGTRALLAGGYFDCVKGNEGEIRTVSGARGVQQRGVDSGSSQLSLEQRVELVRTTAKTQRNVVLMTGSTDVVSDGERTFTVGNGHEYLGEITGSGCTLGTTVSACLAVEKDGGDKLLAVLAAVIMFEIAAERAAGREVVQGPGTFVPAFIDALYQIRKANEQGDFGWIEAAKVETM